MKIVLASYGESPLSPGELSLLSLTSLENKIWKIKCHFFEKKSGFLEKFVSDY